jgi:hypothetical protein
VIPQVLEEEKKRKQPQRQESWLWKRIKEVKRRSDLDPLRQPKGGMTAAWRGIIKTGWMQ